MLYSFILLKKLSFHPKSNLEIQLIKRYLPPPKVVSSTSLVVSKSLINLQGGFTTLEDRLPDIFHSQKHSEIFFLRDCYGRLCVGDALWRRGAFPGLQRWHQ